MVRRRGSIAVLMNSFSSGSSSSSAVCGLGTLTSSISNCFARSRDSSASSSFLMAAWFIAGFLFVRQEVELRARRRVDLENLEHLAARIVQAVLHAGRDVD